MTDKQFPLVADDEIMLTEMPHMNLYDELEEVEIGRASCRERV